MSARKHDDDRSIQPKFAASVTITWRSRPGQSNPSTGVFDQAPRAHLLHSRSDPARCAARSWPPGSEPQLTERTANRTVLVRMDISAEDGRDDLQHPGGRELTNQLCRFPQPRRVSCGNPNYRPPWGPLQEYSRHVFISALRGGGEPAKEFPGPSGWLCSPPNGSSGSPRDHAAWIGSTRTRRPPRARTEQDRQTSPSSW